MSPGTEGGEQGREKPWGREKNLNADRGEVEKEKMIEEWRCLRRRSKGRRIIIADRRTKRLSTTSTKNKSLTREPAAAIGRQGERERCRHGGCRGGLKTFSGEIKTEREGKSKIGILKPSGIGGSHGALSFWLGVGKREKEPRASKTGELPRNGRGKG